MVFTWCKTANLIDYVIVKSRLTGSIQDTSVYKSAFIDVKSKDHNLVMSWVNLKLKFRKGSLTTSKEVIKLVDSRMKI